MSFKRQLENVQINNDKDVHVQVKNGNRNGRKHLKFLFGLVWLLDSKYSMTLQRLELLLIQTAFRQPLFQLSIEGENQTTNESNALKNAIFRSSHAPLVSIQPQQTPLVSQNIKKSHLFSPKKSDPWFQGGKRPVSFSDYRACE